MYSLIQFTVREKLVKIYYLHLFSIQDATLLPPASCYNVDTLRLYEVTRDQLTSLSYCAAPATHGNPPQYQYLVHVVTYQQHCDHMRPYMGFRTDSVYQ